MDINLSRSLIAALMVLPFLSGCGGKSAEITGDPGTIMLDGNARTPQRVAALNATWAEVESGQRDRVGGREQVKMIIWKYKAPPELRLRALEILLSDQTPEGRADTINVLRLAFPTEGEWQMVQAVSKAVQARAADPAWRVMTAPLVRSYSRALPETPDSTRPERAALLAMHPGKDVVDIAYAVFTDPVASGASAGDLADRAREDAWTLLSRLDPDGRERGRLLAAGGAASTENEALADLAKTARDLRVVPISGSELSWMRGLLKSTDAADKKWWAESTAAVARLSPAQVEGLELRHIEAVRWASANRSEWVTLDRGGLVALLGERLASRRTHRASAYETGKSPKGGAAADNPELAWGDLLTILVVDEALQSPGVAAALLGQSLLDMSDTSTEHGGLLLAGDQAASGSDKVSAAFVAQSLASRINLRRDDRTFIAPKDMFYLGGRSLAHYHFHAQTPANAEYAGPGEGDREYAKSHGRNCLVFTSVRRGVLDADFYQRDGVCIDLGEVGEQ